MEEFRKALQIRESLLTPDDRRIAEWCATQWHTQHIELDYSGCASHYHSHFQLGMALTFAKEFDKAIEVSALPWYITHCRSCSRDTIFMSCYLAHCVQSYEFAKGVLKKKLESLSSSGEGMSSFVRDR